MEERWSGWDGAAPPPFEGNLVAACFTRNTSRLALAHCHARLLPEVALEDRASSRSAPYWVLPVLLRYRTKKLTLGSKEAHTGGP
jgi:hypothetical protein